MKSCNWIFFLSIVMYSCNNVSNSKLTCWDNNSELLKADVSVFYNLQIDKALDTHDGINKFFYNTGKEQLIIPSFDKYKVKSEIMDPNKYDVLKFCSLYQVPVEQSFDFTKSYSDSILNMFKRLKISKLFSDPQLGHFIEFTDENGASVVFAPDTARIYQNYWKNYFRTAHKLKNNWYCVE